MFNQQQLGQPQPGWVMPQQMGPQHPQGGHQPPAWAGQNRVVRQPGAVQHPMAQFGRAPQAPVDLRRLPYQWVAQHAPPREPAHEMRIDPGAFPGRDETGDRLDRLCNLVQEIARRQDEITRLIGHPQERPEAERPPDVTHSAPPTERISKFVADEGHVYRMNSRHENRVYYECWTRKKTGCNARISMDITTGEITRRDRAHVSDMCREEHFQQKGRAKQELERVKQWVCSEYTASHGTASCDALYQKVINQFFKSEFSGEYCVAVTPKTVQKWVSETRVEKPAGTIYQLLQKRREQDSNVEHEWLRMADETCGSILLFMTGMQEQELVGVDYLLIDGSFKSCPHGWSQYLNIMGVKSPNNQYFPVAHILLNGKKKEVYIEAFRRLLMFIHDKLPTQIMIVTDFEQALQEAVVTVFTSFKITVRVLGCLFHFSQAIMKKSGSDKGQKCWS